MSPSSPRVSLGIFPAVKDNKNQPEGVKRSQKSAEQSSNEQPLMARSVGVPEDFVFAVKTGCHKR